MSFEHDDDSQRRDHRALTRRTALKTALLGTTGLAAAALVGCGGDDEDKKPEAKQQEAKPGDAGAGAKEAPKEPDYVTAAKADGAPFPYSFPEPETKPKAGGTLRIAHQYAMQRTFDTNQQAELAAAIAGFTANRLIGMVTGPKLDKYKIELEPALAKSWESAPDGLSYTFRLQPNAKFHNVAPVNGRALVAKDVKLAYERAQASGLNRASFVAVDSITAVDETTLKVTMKSPDADFVAGLASRQLPIYAPELYEQKLIDTTAIGTGPAILTDVQKDVRMILKSNPDYWQGKPLIDGVEMPIINDVNARIAAFRAGQIEHGNSVGAQKLDADTILKSNPGVLVTCDPIAIGIGFWAMNTANSKLKDVRVRAAMSLALDRPKLIQLLSQGYGKMLPAFGWPLVFDKEPTGAELGPWWRYDPAEAKKLLQAAGAEGLTLELKWSSTYPRSNKIEVLIPLLRDIGITIQPADQDGPTFASLRFTKRFAEDPKSELMEAYAGPAPTTKGYFYDLVHSKSSVNVHTINDPEIDGWAEQQIRELNPKTRRELLRKIWDKTLAQAYRFENAPGTFAITIMQPWVRYYRWNGVYFSYYYSFDWGWGYHKAWLDK